MKIGDIAQTLFYATKGYEKALKKNSAYSELEWKELTVTQKDNWLHEAQRYSTMSEVPQGNERFRMMYFLVKSLK